jgi:hypothetical protein
MAWVVTVKDFIDYKNLFDPKDKIWTTKNNAHKSQKGVSIFAKYFSGLPARKISKTNVNHFNAFGCPDSSPRFDPTRGRNTGSK